MPEPTVIKHHAHQTVSHVLAEIQPQGATTSAPTRPGAQSKINAQALRFMHRVDKQLLPLRAHKLDRAARDAEVHFEKNCATDARVSHGFQVSGKALAGQVAIHKIPIDPRPRLWRRVLEPSFEVIRSDGEDLA